MGDGGAAAAKLLGSTFAGRLRIVQLLRSGGIANVYVAELLTLRPGPLSIRTSDGAADGYPEGNPEITPRAASDPMRSGRATRLAIKVLREPFRSDRAVIRRFERGVTAARQIIHPNVVRTGPLEHLPEGLPYCTMELLIGLDLADMLAYGHKLDPARAARIAAGAAAGLSAAHAAGVIHLDLKPENIFLVHEPDGGEQVKILDFGLAAATGDTSALRVDSACGTPEYMAPEQRRGVPAAPTMDVYALGVVLREMLTGQAPGSANTQLGDLPPQLATIVKKALAESPRDRFASMEELHAALIGTLERAPSSR